MKIACITPDNKRDYLCETILEGLHAYEGQNQVIVSDPGNGYCKHAMIDGQFLAEANTSDLMLVFFGKVRGNRPPRRYFLDQVNLPKSRIFYVDGSEWSATGWESGDQAQASLVDPSRRRGHPWIDEEMFQRCGKYFKRECYPEDLARGIIPLPFAMCKRHLVENLLPQERDIDVFCSFGHEKTGMRREVREFLERMRGNQGSDGLRIVVRSGMTAQEYQDHLRRSKVVVDAWGGGDTTDRFWEAVGAGCCVMYQRHNVVTPNPYEDWVHAVSYSNLAEFSNNLTLLFEDHNIDSIGCSGLAHALCYHEAKDRAEEILKHVPSR